MVCDLWDLDGSLDFTFSFNREIVEEKVDVLTMEAESRSLTFWEGCADLSFGEAGWNQVGGCSPGNISVRDG